MIVMPCRVFEHDGCRVVCDAVSLEFIKGSRIEFEDTLMRSAFVVRTGFLVPFHFAMTSSICIA